MDCTFPPLRITSYSRGCRIEDLESEGVQGREGIRQADIIIATSSRVWRQSPGPGSRLRADGPSRSGPARRRGLVGASGPRRSGLGDQTHGSKHDGGCLLCKGRVGTDHFFLPAEKKGWFGPLGGSGIFEEGGLVDDGIVLKYVVYDADPLFFFAHQTD